MRQHSFWDTGGQRVVEELDTEDDDSDTQGVGLTLNSTNNNRFVSDPLRFTGIDLGDRIAGTSRRNYAYRQSDAEEDDDESEDASDAYSSGSDEEEEDDELAGLNPREREELLVQSALARIRHAQSKGRADVKLNREELAALQRYRKRMQEEAARKASGSGSGSDRRRRRERDQRFAVPLSELEPTSRKKRSSTLINDPQTRRPSPPNPTGSQERQVYPPMGYFAPPSASRTRPRSSTTTSQRPPSRAHDDRGSSPFTYSYVQHPAGARHVSETVPSRPRSARGNRNSLPPEDAWVPSLSPASSSSSAQGSRNSATFDPFQYQTAGPRAPQSAGAAAVSRRHVSNPNDARRGAAAAPAAARNGRPTRRQATPSDETSEASSDETDEESASDDLGNGAHIGEHPGRSREAAVVVEVSPEREREPSRGKKQSSPSKKKPAARSSSRRRRKK
jgi:PRA1 family protein 1